MPEVQLLATESSPLMVPLIIVGACLGLAILLVGLITRFSRLSWVGLQVVLIYCLSRLVIKIEIPDNRGLQFGLVAGAFFLGTALVLGLGALIRRGFIKRSVRKKRNGFLIFLDSLFGLINVIFNIAIVALVLVGVAYAVPPVKELLDGSVGSVASSVGILNFFYAGLVDFALVGILVAAIKGGYRLGLLRSIWAILYIALGWGALVGSMLAALDMPGISDLTSKIAASLSANMDIALAHILGFAIVTTICFVVQMIVIALLNVLIKLGVRAVDRVKPIQFFDRALVSLVGYVLVIALVLGVNFTVFSVAQGGLDSVIDSLAASLEGIAGEGIGDSLHSAVDSMKDIFVGMEQGYCSAPLSKIFYEYNPIRLIVG